MDAVDVAQLLLLVPQPVNRRSRWVAAFWLNTARSGVFTDLPASAKTTRINWDGMFGKVGGLKDGCTQKLLELTLGLVPYVANEDRARHHSL